MIKLTVKTTTVQEVEGSEASALNSVVAADMELMRLREEEADILERQERGEEGDDREDASTSGMDQESDRLNEIYDRMQVWLLVSLSQAKFSS